VTVLIVLGGILVAAGIFGLGYCIRAGYAIRRDKPAPEVARVVLQRLVAVNLASVGCAAIGLGLIVVGFVF
jgi:hypothetical protein